MYRRPRTMSLTEYPEEFPALPPSADHDARRIRSKSLGESPTDRSSDARWARISGEKPSSLNAGFSPVSKKLSRKKAKGSKRKKKKIVLCLNSSSVSALSSPQWAGVDSGEPHTPVSNADDELLASVPKQELEAVIESPTDNAEECMSTGEVKIPDKWRFWLARSPKHMSAIRFSGKQLLLPHRVRVLDARISFRAYSKSVGPVTLRFWAEASDSAPHFKSFSRMASFDLSTRSKTNSSVVWSPADWTRTGEEHQTPDLSPLINELVQRPGWQRDSAVVILIQMESQATANSCRVAVSWEAFCGQQSARLLLKYQDVAAAPMELHAPEPVLECAPPDVPAVPSTPEQIKAAIVPPVPPPMAPPNEAADASHAAKLLAKGVHCLAAPKTPPSELLQLEFLCLDGTQVPMQVASSTTVRQMKQKLQQLLGRHACLPELWVNDESCPQLHDAHSVAECGISAGATVYVLEGADSKELLHDMLLQAPALRQLWGHKLAIFEHDDGNSMLDELRAVKSDGAGNVVSLNLASSKIESLPDSFGKFATLVSVNFANCCLSVLPESFCDLSALQSLIASENQLAQLPHSFGHLEMLEHLDLRMNALACLPESFTELGKLEFCNLAGNSLAALPERFGDLISLQTCYLHGNELCSLPDSFGSLANLDELKLGDWFGSNPLRRLPASMAQLAGLSCLCLEHCPLEISEPEKRALEAALDGCEFRWPRKN